MHTTDKYSKTIELLTEIDKQVAFLVRILVRECIKRKNDKKMCVFFTDEMVAFVCKDYFVQNPYV